MTVLIGNFNGAIEIVQNAKVSGIKKYPYWKYEKKGEIIFFVNTSTFLLQVVRIFQSRKQKTNLPNS